MISTGPTDPKKTLIWYINSCIYVEYHSKPHLTLEVITWYKFRWNMTKIVGAVGGSFRRMDWPLTSVNTFLRSLIKYNVIFI